MSKEDAQNRKKSERNKINGKYQKENKRRERSIGIKRVQSEKR